MPDIPAHCVRVMEAVASGGYEVYVVGGAVRDILLGNEPHDFDLASSASPDELMRLLKEHGIRVFTGTGGMKHGTVTAVAEGQTVEITSFRSEDLYSDGRHPDHVSFGASISEDVRRRDFTVNAMYLSADGRVVDLVGGRKDLEDNVIRCVGDPDVRFREDALRILRAMRFASERSMTIEDATSEAMHRNRDLLDGISAERKTAELTRILTGDNVSFVISRYRDIIKVVFPDIGDIDVIAPILGRTGGHDETVAFSVALAGRDRGSIRAAGNRMRFSGKLMRDVTLLTEHMNVPLPEDKTEVKRLVGRLSRENMERLCLIRGAMGDDTSAFRKTVNRLISEGACTDLAGLSVSGTDVAELGASGKQIGEILDTLLEKVITGELPNDRDTLIGHIKKLITE